MAKTFKGDPAAIGKILFTRVRNKLSRFKQRDPELREAMLRSALLIEAHAKVNIRKKLNKHPQGALINSIGHRFLNATTLQVGSFGVPYARIHEFGRKDHRARIARSLAIPIAEQFRGRRARDVPDLFRGKKEASDILFQKQADGTWQEKSDLPPDLPATANCDYLRAPFFNVLAT